VSGCPYKKVYFNWKTGRAEKCIFCYPRIAAAAAPHDREVYPAHLDILLDPNDLAIARAAAAQGIAPNFMAAECRLSGDGRASSPEARV
jgi:nitrate reductase beta subunit